MTTYFISDTHFGHANIIRFCKRPFADVSAMDEALIRNWNDTVGQDDDVWHLGDFSSYRDGRLAAVFWRLNGRKHLVIGNHDEENEAVLDLPWEEPPIQQGMLSVEGRRVFVNHYPLRSWPKIGKGAVHLFGHMHGRLQGTRQSTDMGVDCWSFRPVALADIDRRLKSHPPVPAIDQPGAVED